MRKEKSDIITNTSKIVVGINEGINNSVVFSQRGRILFALEEERVSRKKVDIGFPHQSLAFALDYLGLSPSEVSHVCFSNLISPMMSKQQFLKNYELPKYPGLSQVAQQSREAAKSIIRALVPEGLLRRRRAGRLKARDQLWRDALHRHDLGHVEIVRTHHHHNHAAAAYYGLRGETSKPRLILTLDGGGDDSCSHVYLAQNGKMEFIAATPIGHSLGNIYSRVTHMMGFRPHEHEHKVMGLAAYTEPKLAVSVMKKFSGYLDLDPENPLLFRRKIPEPTYDIGPRLVTDFKDIRSELLAAGLQDFTEKLLVRWVEAVIEKTGVGDVLTAGGVFMNVKANKRISEIPGLLSFDVFPSCGDETLPFGAIWLHGSKNNDNENIIDPFDIYQGPDAGFDLDDAKDRYDGKVSFEKMENPVDTAAQLLSDGEVVAWCQGRMEFGARALGNRSILADPINPQVVDQINKMVKMRDLWMPFAPAVLAEHAAGYIDIPATLNSVNPSPWMMHSFDTTQARKEFIAGVHAIDNTARAQIVTREANPRFHELISRFHELTGRAAVLNTSFNLHGYPIVLGACDAIDVLLNSGLSHLVVNDVLIRKL